jgi:HEAT repeat protein
MRVFIFLFLLCLLSTAHASRRVAMPIAYYAKQTQLAVIADFKKPQAPAYECKLTVREVLQGEAQIGEVIRLPLRAVADSILPYSDATTAVLLKASDTAEEGQNFKWQALVAYTDPTAIAALRLLLPVFRLTDERKQILALQKIVPDEAAPVAAYVAKELDSALRDLRQAENFDLIESSLPLLDEKARYWLLGFTGQVNDERAVPLLIKSLSAPEKSVKISAARTLIYSYPGAPGVTAAMRAALGDDVLKPFAQEYLSKRDATITVNPPHYPELSEYHRAKAAFRDNRNAATAFAVLRVLQEKETNTHIVVWAGEEVLPFLDNDGKALLRTLILQQAARRNNYLEAESLVKLIRQMPNVDFVPALQKLLHDEAPSDLPYFLTNADRMAAFTLRDLGPRAREIGAAQIMDFVQQRLKPGANPRFGEAEILLRQLAWLADDATWQLASGLLDAQWRSEWRMLDAIRPALTAPTREREARALLEVLELPQDKLTMGIRDWIIYRLGDLRDRAAIAPLLELLPKMATRYPPTVKESLILIGGEQVEEGTLRLLHYSDESVRRQALEILNALRGEKIRPLLRLILKPDSTFGHKADALWQMGSVGTPDDIPLLLSYSDFWKTDRILQRNAVSALSSVRSRFNYDVNSPIRKEN